MGTFRRRQRVISFIGSALIIPYYAFFALTFDFSAKASDKPSGWEIVFKAAAFGGPILGIISSFLIPRVAAYWMFACSGISLSIGVGFQIHWAKAPDAAPLTVASWAAALPALFRMLLVFWFLPVLFGSLLI
jgi:hypothetical protein